MHPDSEFEELWRESWRNVAAIGPLTHARFRIVLRLVAQELKSARCVLDVGCGSGTLLALIRRENRGCALEGLEPSRSAIEAAPLPIRELITCAEVSDLAKRAGPPVDVVICSEVLEHLDDAAGALLQIRGCLEPRGVAVFTVPARMKYWSVQDDVAHHRRRFEPEEFKALLEASGFDVSTLFLWGRGPLARLYNRLISKAGPERVMRIGPRFLPTLLSRVVGWALRVEDFWPGRDGFQLFAKAHVTASLADADRTRERR